MSEKKVKIYLDDILDSIDKIYEFTGDVAREAFYKNTEKQYAVIKCLEIIGEAVRAIPETYKAKNPGIPWKKINAMRNILIHAYGSVDLEEVWRVIEKDLPVLKRKIASLKEKNGSGK
jgi:uncharacterized protein with HEPN domain